MTDASADVPYEKLAKQLQTLAGLGYRDGAPAVAASAIPELAALLSSLEPGTPWPQSAARALDRAIAALGTQLYLTTRLEAAYVGRVFIGKLLGRERLDPEPKREYGQRIGSLRIETGLEEKGDSPRNLQRHLTGTIKKMLITELLELTPTVTALMPSQSDVARDDFVPRGEAENTLRAALTDETARAIWVSGEVGVGKSRLIRHLIDDIFGDNAHVVRCSSADRYRGDLARIMRYLTGQHYEDSAALLEEAVTGYLHLEKCASTLIYFDGLDNIAADDILTKAPGVAGRLVVSSRLPPPPEIAPDFKVVRLSDMQRHEAISLVRNLAPILSERDAERVATVLHCRPAAIDVACRYLMQHRETNLDEFLRDLLLPDHALAMLEYVSSPASERLASVYINTIQSLANDSDALLVLDTLTCCLPGIPYPRSVLNAIWAFATDAPLIADPVEDEKLSVLFRSKGSIIHHSLWPSRKLTQYDSMRLSAKLAKLEALGLVAIDGTDPIISSHTQQIVAYCRRKHFEKSRLLILDSFFEALKCCGWRPGESLPKLLTEWALRLPLPDAAFVAKRPDDAAVLYAVVLRTVRQLRWNLDSLLAPFQAAWGRELVENLLADLLPDIEMSSDPGRIAYVIEVTRLLAAQGQTFDTAEIVKMIDEYGRRPFDHERMVASELSSCSLVNSADYIEHYERRSVDLKFAYDGYDPATQVKYEGGLALPKELFACARVAAFSGEFKTSAELYLRSAKAYHAVGASLAAMAGEYRARGGAVDSLLRAGEFTAALSVGKTLEQLDEWHRTSVYPAFPQLELMDKAVQCAVSDTSHELSIMRVAHQAYEAQSIESSTTQAPLGYRLDHCKHLASLEFEHGSTVQHAEQLSRQVLLALAVEARICVGRYVASPDVFEPINWTPALLQSQSWIIHTALNLTDRECGFGYRQLIFNSRLAFLVVSATYATLGADVVEMFAAPYVPDIELFSKAELQEDPDLAQCNTVNEIVDARNLRPTAAGFVGLAAEFRDLDGSKYWEAKALAVAACSEICGIEGFASGDATIVSAGREAASRMGRRDWDAAIRASEHDLLRALVLFAVL